MALVMLGEQELVAPVEIGQRTPELPAQKALLKELLANPQRDRLVERAKAARREGDVSLDQALELEKGLVVEGHEVDRFKAAAALFQTVVDGLAGEVRIVLAAREPLLLRRRHDAAVLDQRRRGIVVEGRDAEDTHRL